MSAAMIGIMLALLGAAMIGLIILWETSVRELERDVRALHDEQVRLARWVEEKGD